MNGDFVEATNRAAAAARDAIAPDRAGSGERAMAAVAQRALFDEALLGALKARVAELRTVAK